ncbi:MAG: tryptophan synthase subunit alpha [Phycisphaerales bacterium]|nr:tryptophan synthase subunit alpha [Phycisphaerales bacterium]
MKRLSASFESSARGRRSILPYITAGFPNAATTIAILDALDPALCPCVELGIPFSDPIADGPVIQASFSRALACGFRLSPFLEALGAAQSRIRVPLVAMVSYSIGYRRGIDSFARELRAAGIEGLLMPDLSLEEIGDTAARCATADVALVAMVAPTTSAERRRRLADISRPFVYYQSTVGVTGERAALPPELREDVAALRATCGKPVCVGFGISRSEHVAAVCEFADGAIVGSAIVRRVLAAADAGRGPAEIARDIATFVAELAA